MKQTFNEARFPLIRPAMVLCAILLAAYIPLKIYLARSGDAHEQGPGPIRFGIFITNELQGYREPCG